MVATCVYIHVKPEFVEEFIQECIVNHNQSILEPGNIRFDVIQEEENNDCFLLYEAYENEEAVVAHKNTEHYKVWRNNVEQMMATPRKGVKHTIICPKVIK